MLLYAQYRKEVQPVEDKRKYPTATKHTRMVNVRFPLSVYEMLREQAETEGQTMTEIITRAVETDLIQRRWKGGCGK